MAITSCARKAQEEQRGEEHVEDGGDCWQTLRVRALLYVSPWESRKASGRLAFTASASGRKNQVLDSLCDLLSAVPGGGGGGHRPSRHPAPVGSSMTFLLGAPFSYLSHDRSLAVLKHRRVCDDEPVTNNSQVLETKNCSQ